MQPVWKGRIFDVAKINVSDTLVYDAVLKRPAVAILPITDDNNVVMIRQVRPVIGPEPLWEIPAGIVDSGETPLDAALRELEEEVGYVGDLTYLGEWYSSPGFTNELLIGYVAKNLKPTQTKHDPEENIEIVPIPIDEVYKMVQTGQIIAGSSLPVILMYYFLINYRF